MMTVGFLVLLTMNLIHRRICAAITPSYSRTRQNLSLVRTLWQHSLHIYKDELKCVIDFLC